MQDSPYSSGRHKGTGTEKKKVEQAELPGDLSVGSCETVY